MDTLSRLADLLERSSETPYRWECDIPDCDGQPHDGWPHKHARAAQHRPTDPNVSIWLLKCGRGWGKTRTAAEAFADHVLAHPLDADGIRTEWLVAGETFADTRQVCVAGKSGLLQALKLRNVGYRYDKSKWEITILTPEGDGQLIYVQGGDDPDCGRGKNLSGAWIDEAAKWDYFEEAWEEGIGFAVRIDTADGGKPFVIVSTTPKPKTWIKEWLSRKDGSIFVTNGSTFENEDNLSSFQLDQWKSKHGGTRRGRQELYGEYLDDVEGALWNRAMFEPYRKTGLDWEAAVDDGLVRRIVIGVDPAVTSGEDADETGIVAAALMADGRIWIIDDRSCHESPDRWARRVDRLFADRAADRIIAEVNNGGELVTHVLKTVNPALPVTTVTASRGKRVRAEPVAALYEQGRVSHLGDLHQLEDELVSWTPEDPGSPDRMDAMVWAVSSLMNRGGFSTFMDAWAKPESKPSMGVADIAALAS